MADLRLAAWFLWMTPLLAALSSSLVALRSAVVAAAASLPSAASRKRRTAVLSSDFTALLRSRRRSLVRLRLICDLMLATRDLPPVCEGCVAGSRGCSRRGYQRVRPCSQSSAIRPWTAWNWRTVGIPGGGGCPLE